VAPVEGRASGVVSGCEMDRGRLSGKPASEARLGPVALGADDTSFLLLGTAAGGLELGLGGFTPNSGSCLALLPVVLHAAGTTAKEHKQANSTRRAALPTLPASRGLRILTHFRRWLN